MGGAIGEWSNSAPRAEPCHWATWVAPIFSEGNSLDSLEIRMPPLALPGPLWPSLRPPPPPGPPWPPPLAPGPHLAPPGPPWPPLAPPGPPWPALALHKKECMPVLAAKAEVGIEGARKGSILGGSLCKLTAGGKRNRTNL